MQTIWKYEIQTADRQSVSMPENAIPLAVDTQYGRPCLWALVEPDEPREQVTVEVFGTGHPIQPRPDRRYVGTYQLQGGSLIFHVFITQPSANARS
jgi:hypothetical protein